MKNKARKFAFQHHGEQKYGEHPYIVHLDAVAALVQVYGETAVVIAYLHDVVEDTDVTLSEVSKGFGLLVADCVAVLTDEPGKDRHERKEQTYRKMAKVVGEREIALVVKAADRLANMRACLADKKEDLLAVYRKEFPVFQQAVYRPGLCEEIWSALAELMPEQQE
ncbi:MAG: bifunctional (p)ppGpp synthetase/guanosine-3',5'-bis(diphosphate) 3'-pyrophosphohydrolase [Candidatus Electrothrix sp. AUS4]|nr:bifunctional (p)ppGpp synthetase/guanosine-3',5'-bis(diphosphate) 3'-pyrophosphohydrolase [Candidatus Electrothrix sp. AUS4]